MQSFDDLSCPVCLELSRNAVESECCGHAFCEECANLIKGKQNQCPYCKQSPFKFRQAKLIRRMISGMKVSCPNQKCQIKIANSDLKQHLQYCLFTNSKCRVCKQSYIRAQLIKHTIEKHEDQTKKAIIDYHNSTSYKTKASIASTMYSSKASNSSVSSIPAGNGINDPIQQVINKVGRKSVLGDTGKYYCMGPLLLKCKCCDGNCGPGNGQNCVACMQLDIKRRNLPKQYLVNAAGIITKVNYKTGTAYCGLPMSNIFNLASGKCSIGNQCRFCRCLMQTLKRYENLLI